MKLVTLKRRRDFVEAARGENSRNWATPTVVVQSFPFEDKRPDVIHVGYTATKRLGAAVVRNRVRRRLRSAVSRLLPGLAVPGRAYVFIGRPATANCPYQCLLDDLEKALIKLQPNKPTRRRQAAGKGAIRPSDGPRRP